MAGWWLLSDNPTLGIRVYVQPLEGHKGCWRVRREYYHAKGLIEQNKRQIAAYDGKPKWGDGRRVAAIPPNLYHDLLGEAVAQRDDKYMKKILNDSDYRDFRVFPGKV